MSTLEGSHPKASPHPQGDLHHSWHPEWPQRGCQVGQPSSKRFKAVMVLSTHRTSHCGTDTPQTVLGGGHAAQFIHRELVPYQVKEWPVILLLEGMF